MSNYLLFKNKQIPDQCASTHPSFPSHPHAILTQHTPHLELSSSRYLPIKQSGRHKSGQISKKSLANKDIEFNNNMGQHPA